MFFRISNQVKPSHSYQSKSRYACLNGKRVSLCSSNRWRNISCPRSNVYLSDRRGQGRVGGKVDSCPARIVNNILHELNRMVNLSGTLHRLLQTQLGKVSLDRQLGYPNGCINKHDWPMNEAEFTPSSFNCQLKTPSPR